MKINLFKLLISAIVFFPAQIMVSQPLVDWQLVGNVTFPGQFLGTINAQPLHAQTMLGQPIRFRTNFGAAPLGFGNRMIITDGGFGNNNGQIAMGNSLPDGFVPVDRLHLHQNGGNTFIRFSNAIITGSFPNDGMRFGMLLSGAGELRLFDNPQFVIRTFEGTWGLNERMRIQTGIGWSNGPILGVTKVSISRGAGSTAMLNPVAMLNVGNFATNGAGQRQWMDVGLFMNDSSDNVYVGLKREPGFDEHDAVFSWGDNYGPTSGGSYDNLRFIFTAPFSLAAQPNTAQHFDGKEVARLTPTGRFGIGDWTLAANLIDTISHTLDVDGNARIRILDTIPAPFVVLADSDGCLFKRPVGIISSFVGDCGLNQFPFAVSKEFSMNNFNFVFSGQGGLNNRVGVGTLCTPGAKLDVFETNGPIGIRSIQNAVSFGTIAGWFEVNAPLGLGAYAIITPPSKGVTGLGTVTPGAQLQVGNASDGTGALANAWNIFSDSTLKTNVQTMTDGLAIIGQLRPVTFDWINNGDFGAGIIAQEAEDILPHLVYTDTINNLKSIDYGKIVPYLMSAVIKLKAILDSVTGNNLRLDQSIQNIVLESDIVLYQNMPNPFSDETSIRYFIPENVSSARILFYDETGRIIKEESIQTLGNGTLTIKTSGLASGIYTYALEVNGKIMQTRKMQKVK